MKRAGIMISEIAFSNLPVLMKNAGLDFFILDCEHGGFDYAAVANFIMNARLCGLEIIVRLADNGRKDTVKFADMGADGFLLPMTDCADDIARVVRYAKYRPVGERGISTMRAHTFYNPPPINDYLPSANERVKVYAQIETACGVERAAEILSVNGVEGAFVGPNDLSADYGCLGNPAAAEILRAIERVQRAAEKAGKRAGIITGNENYLERASACGYSMFCKGSELNAISEYCKAVVKSLNVE